MRNKKRGYPKTVSIGYRKSEKDRIKEKIIKTFEDMKKVHKGERIKIAKFGKKNREKIAEIAKEKGIIIENINIKKILRKNNQKKEKMEDKKWIFQKRKI